MSINEYRHKQPKHSLGTFNVLIGTWDEEEYFARPAPRLSTFTRTK